MPSTIQVAIVGAGPAGLFAAEQLAQEGYAVALFNRDIKPGGMAEYGIYPDKHHLKDGLRKTSYAISTDETRYVLNGIYAIFREGKLTLVATDGRRLTRGQIFRRRFMRNTSAAVPIFR